MNIQKCLIPCQVLGKVIHNQPHFSIFINDLYLKLDQLKSGLFINDRHIPMLLYADDLVVLAETPQKLQYMLVLPLSSAQNGC